MSLLSEVVGIGVGESGSVLGCVVGAGTEENAR